MNLATAGQIELDEGGLITVEGEVTTTQKETPNKELSSVELDLQTPQPTTPLTTPPPSATAPNQKTTVGQINQGNKTCKILNMFLVFTISQIFNENFIQ